MPTLRSRRTLWLWIYPENIDPWTYYYALNKLAKGGRGKEQDPQRIKRYLSTSSAKMADLQVICGRECPAGVSAALEEPKVPHVSQAADVGESIW